MTGSMWSNYLGAVSKAGIKYPHQLVMGRVGGDCEIVGLAGAEGALLSTFYVMIISVRMNVIKCLQSRQKEVPHQYI